MDIFITSCMKNTKSDFDSFMKNFLHWRKALHPCYLVNPQQINIFSLPLELYDRLGLKTVKGISLRVLIEKRFGI